MSKDDARDPTTTTDDYQTMSNLRTLAGDLARTKAIRGPPETVTELRDVTSPDGVPVGK